MENKKSTIYVTYDLDLKRYLTKCNIQNILTGLNANTKNRFWVYERTDDLNNILINWYQNIKNC